MKKVSVVLFSFLSLLFYSCFNAEKILSIDEIKLFELNYGNFEEQLNLFDVSKIGAINTSLTMRDGFFYIVNGESEKILSLNSYGDLLSLYYSEDFYSGDKEKLRTKANPAMWKPVSYPFKLNGTVSVDSRKYMYSVG